MSGCDHPLSHNLSRLLSCSVRHDVVGGPNAIKQAGVPGARHTVRTHMHRQIITVLRTDSILMLRKPTSFLTVRLLEPKTRSSAVPVIADGTAYDVGYIYKPLSGIAVVSMNAYLFTVSN